MKISWTLMKNTIMIKYYYQNSWSSQYMLEYKQHIRLLSISTDHVTTLLRDCIAIHSLTIISGPSLSFSWYNSITAIPLAISFPAYNDHMKLSLLYFFIKQLFIPNFASYACPVISLNWPIHYNSFKNCTLKNNSVSFSFDIFACFNAF